jgi:histidyl-tRNA synthetase
MSSLQAPRGTFDVLPPDAARRLVLETHARRILGAAGYGRIETPTYEATELFARGVGEATDIVQKEMYSFDDGAGRSMTLRPEGTAPVSRAYLEHGMHKLPQPVKLWYLSSFFRAEAPQRGRYRQFWQVGAEAIGAAGPETDAELILLMADLFRAVGVTDLHLRLSSLGTAETRREYREELAAWLHAHEDGLSPEVVARIDLNPMRAFDADDRRTQETMRDAPILLNRLAPEDAEHFERVKALLHEAGLTYELDPTLVRGLDYYARTLWEFTSGALGAQSAVGGGGRYDGLIEQLGGASTPGVGWAAGVERMLLAAGDQPVPAQVVDLFVAIAARDSVQAHDAGFKLANEARRAGLSAQLELAGRGLKGQLKHADRLGARYVAIIGDPMQISLKDMEAGNQTELSADAVIPTILRGSRVA